MLSENEDSLLTQAGALGRTLQELQRVDAGAAQSGRIACAGRRRRCANCRPNLSRYADKVDIDPARLAELEERLNLLHSLKRKYGATLAEVIAFGDEAKRNCNRSNSRDAELARLNAELQKLDAEILTRGQKTFRQRARKSFRNWPKP